MIVRTAILVALLVGCSSTRKKPRAPEQRLAAVRSDLRRIDLAIPPESRTSFSVCDAGLVLVPAAGGLALAGWGGWVVEPGGDTIDSVACASSGDIYVLRGTRLARIQANGESYLALTLPAGRYSLAEAVDAGTWIWGQTARGSWIVALYDGEKLLQVHAGREPITALAAAGSNAVIAGVGHNVVMWSHEGEGDVIARLDQAIDGLAVAGDGSIFISTERGVWRRDESHDMTLVAVGTHGALVLRHWTLYVLWRDGRRIVRLRPTDEAIALNEAYRKPSEAPEPEAAPESEPDSTEVVATDPETEVIYSREVIPDTENAVDPPTEPRRKSRILRALKRMYLHNQAQLSCGARTNSSSTQQLSCGFRLFGLEIGYARDGKDEMERRSDGAYIGFSPLSYGTWMSRANGTLTWVEPFAQLRFVELGDSRFRPLALGARAYLTAQRALRLGIEVGYVLGDVPEHLGGPFVGVFAGTAWVR